MPFLRGLIVRLSLGALPLVVVIALCCLMMGWPGRADSHPDLISSAPPPELTAQAAVVPPAERVSLSADAQSSEELAMAGFQRQHIEHAHLHVPH